MALALRLQKDLIAEGLDVWLDKERIGGGVSWTRAIEEAIDRAKVVLALLTPGSYASDICRAEQLRSLRKGKCVIPVLAAQTDIPLYFEPQNYRDFTRARGYAASLQALLGDIQGLKGIALRERYRKYAGNIHLGTAGGTELHRPAGSDWRAAQYIIRGGRAPAGDCTDGARRHGRHREDGAGAGPVPGRSGTAGVSRRPGMDYGGPRTQV